MSKRMSIFVVVALVTLLGLQIGDFLMAPQTVGSWARSQVGFRQVKSELVSAYERGGLDEVMRLSHSVIEKNGIYFTVVVYDLAWGSGGKYYRGKDVIISAHFTPFEASVAKGVSYYRADDLREYANSIYSPPVQNLCVYAEPACTYDFRLSWTEDKNNGNDM